jgi:hypothetical protein
MAIRPRGEDPPTIAASIILTEVDRVAVFEEKGKQAIDHGGKGVGR